MIQQHLDKNNLHHAYLIEGSRDQVVPEILKFCTNLNIKTIGNPDLCQISIDNFKIEEAFSLRAMSSEKSLLAGKKIFIICFNHASIEAQNVLLKMFEEPITHTHFFLIVPDTNALLKTLVSRFYLISPRQPARQLTDKDLVESKEEAEKFIAMSLNARINFLKDFLTEEEEEETTPTDSTRAKSLRFLNALESVVSKTVFDTRFFEHLFKVREFLRMPGSSTKSLLESVALITPNFKI